MMEDILADAAQDGTAHHAETPRAHHDHGPVMLVHIINDDLSWPTNFSLDTAPDLE